MALSLFQHNREAYEAALLMLSDPILMNMVICNFPTDEKIKMQNDKSVSENQPSFMPPPQYEKSERWVQEYKEPFGTEPSFFII